MKYIFYILSILLITNLQASAQTFDFSLTGNPVNTAGWNMSPQSSVNNDEIVLTNPTATQSGYIYFNTPQNLANCSQFTVSFDFRVTNGSYPPADGIAFWYITNPPTGFVLGGGLGLPSNPDGLLVLLDVYNNDGLPDNNPLVSLRRLNGTSDYVEGSSTGLITPDLDYQSFIADGNWHSCKIEYYYGTVSVSFDNNPPVISGNTNLNINGYFGFSASTGALWAKHAIKNVHITGALEPAPPVVDSIFYCLNEPAGPINISESDIYWYSAPSGGSPLPEAPTPNTATAGVSTWYVSSYIPGCDIESQRVPVIVTVQPLPEFDKYAILCPAGSFQFYDETLTEPGVYKKVVPSEGPHCDSLVILHLSASAIRPPLINPKGQVDICEGDELEVRILNPDPDADYQWLRNDHDLKDKTDSIYHIVAPGIYQAKIMMDGCFLTSEELTIDINPNPTAGIMDPEKNGFCAYDTLTLNAVATSGYSYFWEPEEVFRFNQDNSYTSSIAGIFTEPETKVTLMVTNEAGCTDKAAVIIYTKPCCEISIPTAFSPNNDGLNDYFKPIMDVGQEMLSLSIYNRYGQLVYKTLSKEPGWNGKTANGQDADIGTYMYIISYSCAGKKFELKNDLTLVR